MYHFLIWWEFLLAPVMFVLVVSCVKRLISEVRIIMKDYPCMQLYYYRLCTYLFQAGPGKEDKEDFEFFCRYANRVAMDDAKFDTLKRAVDEHLPTKPFYVCTINKSNIVKGKAKMVKLCFCYIKVVIHF